MGRIVRELMLGGRRVIAVFDTGSERSYIRRDSLPKDAKCERIEPFRVRLGGRKLEITEACVIVPKIEGMRFDLKAHLVDEIGEVEGRPVDLIVGCTAMEEWDIRLDPSRRELDLSGVRKRKFTEFWG